MRSSRQLLYRRSVDPERQRNYYAANLSSKVCHDEPGNNGICDALIQADCTCIILNWAKLLADGWREYSIVMERVFMQTVLTLFRRCRLTLDSRTM